MYFYVWMFSTTNHPQSPISFPHGCAIQWRDTFSLFAWENEKRTLNIFCPSFHCVSFFPSFHIHLHVRVYLFLVTKWGLLVQSSPYMCLPFNKYELKHLLIDISGTIEMAFIHLLNKDNPSKYLNVSYRIYVCCLLSDHAMDGNCLHYEGFNKIYVQVFYVPHNIIPLHHHFYLLLSSRVSDPQTYGRIERISIHCCVHVAHAELSV